MFPIDTTQKKYSHRCRVLIWLRLIINEVLLTPPYTIMNDISVWVIIIFALPFHQGETMQSTINV
jgi:hypothetical protein